MAHRILIADDDADLRQIAADLLSSLGYVVTSVANGEDALRAVREEKPDLVVLDMALPKISGWGICKQLREESEFAKLPIIAFTAHALKGDREKALAAGCSGYVSKPFKVDALVEEVRRLLIPLP